jgi:nucleoside-diphosphate-sugar epimerase
MLPDKNILVTGGTGLIGSHLVFELIKNGANVSVFERKKERRFDRLGEIREEIKTIYGDISENKKIEDAVADADYIFHLASVINVQDSIKFPEKFKQINTDGIFNVLESIRLTKSDAFFIYCSSGNVYGKIKYLPIDEDHPIKPKDPYGASKAAGELFCSSYSTTYGIRCSIIRPFHVFGPSQELSQLIPQVITQCLLKDTLNLGSLEFVRDFTYVKDVVDALIAVAEKKEEDIFNIASGKETKVSVLVDKIINIIGEKGKVTIVADESRMRPKGTEVNKVVVDISKAIKILGWKPSYDLDAALHETIRWYKDNRDLW